MDMNDPAGAAPSPQNLPDSDPQETREWLDALDAVIKHEGPVRAQYLLEQLVARARVSGAYIPYNANTAYMNTIPPEREERGLAFGLERPVEPRRPHDHQPAAI